VFTDANAPSPTTRFAQASFAQMPHAEPVARTCQGWPLVALPSALASARSNVSHAAGQGVLVGVGVFVTVGVLVRVGVSVAVGVGECVPVGTRVGVGVAVAVNVFVAVGVEVLVAVGVEVLVPVGVRVDGKVLVGVEVRIGVFVGPPSPPRRSGRSLGLGVGLPPLPRAPWSTKRSVPRLSGASAW
jgi:hypothetical protein